jgi:hypothetical protein
MNDGYQIRVVPPDGFRTCGALASAPYDRINVDFVGWVPHPTYMDVGIPGNAGAVSGTPSGSRCGDLHGRRKCRKCRSIFLPPGLQQSETPYALLYEMKSSAIQFRSIDRK